jgi:Tetratricopeptide repeat
VSGRPNQLIEAGLWLKMSGDVDGARRLFEQALKLEPANARARELLGQAPPLAEAVPEELRDVPVTRTDLFSVPLPRLFPEEVPTDPAAMPEDWWSSGDASAAASGFVLPPPGDPGVGRSQTLPWGPSPIRERTPGPRGSPSRPREPTPSSGAGTPPSTPTPPPVRLREATPPPGTGAPAVPLPAVQPLPPFKAMSVTPAPRKGKTRETPGVAAPGSGAVPLPPGSSPSSSTPTPTPTPLRSRGKSRRKGKRSGEPTADSGAVPLPSAREAHLPEGTPIGGSLSVTGHPAVDLTPAHTPPVVGETPRLPLAGSGPPPSFPRDAWGVDEGPTLIGTEDGPGALELVGEPRIPTGLTPPPAPRDTRSEAQQLLRRAQELQGLDDHSGAREVLLRAQALHAELPGLPEALARSEAKLQTIYESKIGKLSSVPRVRLKDDEVIWLNLDHRAGFMLAQIDGTLSFEDLFSVSGMSRLDTARILAQLLEQRVIIG